VPHRLDVWLSFDVEPDLSPGKDGRGDVSHPITSLSSPIATNAGNREDPTVAELSLLERLFLVYGTVLPNHPRKWWLHPQLRKWLGVRVDREMEVVRGGLRWSLNPSDFPHDGLFWLGSKDTWDLHHVQQYVAPGGVVLDVGANFGHYALSLATAMNRVGQIHALEPDPVNFERLCRHIATVSG
jgi:hypothetical protein